MLETKGGGTNKDVVRTYQPLQSPKTPSCTISKYICPQTQVSSCKGVNYLVVLVTRAAIEVCLFLAKKYFF